MPRKVVISNQESLRNFYSEPSPDDLISGDKNPDLNNVISSIFKKECSLQ